jgi:hypothetical protein
MGPGVLENRRAFGIPPQGWNVPENVNYELQDSRKKYIKFVKLSFEPPEFERIFRLRISGGE